MEYIATYGWAFIVIFITLGTLFYFNIFDFSPYVDSRCEFYSGIYCNEFIVNQTDILLIIQNGLPIDIASVSVAVEGCGAASGQTTLASGEEQLYTISCDLNTDLFDGTIEFNYTNPDSGIEHIKLGRLIEKIV